MAPPRSVKLDDALEQGSRFTEKPALDVTSGNRLLPERFSRQPDLGLRELEERSRVGLDGFTRALEMAMRNPLLAEAPREDGRIDCILAGRHVG